MERVNLLSTDQSSSEVRMTATGQNHTGTRTRAAKGLFSHFMFLAGLLLITLFVSASQAKAQDDTYTVVMAADASTCHINAPGEPIAIATKSFTLEAAENYTLPAELESVVYDVDNANTSLTKKATEQDFDGANQFCYDPNSGEVTISSATTIEKDKVITITATAIANASLSALTYTIAGGQAVSINDFVATTTSYNVTELDYTTAATVTLSGTATSGSSITEPSAANIESQTDGTKTATATIEVTSDGGGASTTYTVNFTFNKAKITAITAPSNKTLDHRASTVEEAIEQLPTTVDVTAEDLTVTTLDLTWTCAEFSAEAAAENTFSWTATVPETLNENGQTTTGTITVTNAAASTDTKLATLTYTIGDDQTAIEIITEAETDATAQKYDVTLPATVAQDATIKVTATTTDTEASVAYDNQSVTLSDNKATVNLTITAESEATRTVAVNFTRTPSDDATLKSLTYKVGEAAEQSVEHFAVDGTSYSVTLPYTTSATAEVTVTATPNSPYATVAKDADPAQGPTAPTAIEPMKVTLAAGVATLSFTVTAEDELATQKVAINFTTAKEKITSVTAPTAPELTEAMEAAAVLEEVQKITSLKATGESGEIDLFITWALLEGSKFTDVPGASNTYVWTITANEAYDMTGLEATSGEMVVVNYVKAITGDQSNEDVEISDSKGLFNQIGTGEGEATTVNSVTVSSPLEKLSFNNTTVKEDVTVSEKVSVMNFSQTTITKALNIDADVETINLANTEIKSEINVTDAATDLSVAITGAIQVAKLTNAGKLTLTNGVEYKMMLLDTKAAGLENSGIDVVENNGTLIDNTSTIFTVDGAANVAITQLPKSQSTTGDKVDLSVATAAPTDDAAISYQWQIQSESEWKDITGCEDAAVTIGRVSYGTTSYRCEVTSTKGTAQTILYTPAASVTFKSAGDPTPSDPTPTPSTKTYTVTLKKVTGATFSKGETTEVEEGDNFSFSIKLDKDYDQSKSVVKVGTTTYEPDAKGVYTIKNISKDITIEVSGIVKNAATGVEETAQDAVRVWGEGSTLYIHTPEAAEVYVISGAGALQRQLKAVPGDQNLQLPAGFYIVRVGTYTVKVIIR